MLYQWNLGNNPWGSVQYFYHMGPEDQTQGDRLGGKYLYSLSHLTSLIPWLFFFCLSVVCSPHLLVLFFLLNDLFSCFHLIPCLVCCLFHLEIQALLRVLTRRAKRIYSTKRMAILTQALDSVLPSHHSHRYRATILQKPDVCLLCVGDGPA